MKVYFVGDDSATSRFKSQPFDRVIEIIKEQSIIALDTETNVTDSILKRILKVISVAWNTETDADMAVFDYDYLSEQQKKILLNVLKSKKCIIHNSTFDYQVLRNEDCILENTICTYLGEQILTTGLPSEDNFHDLKSILFRRFELDISKGQRLTFGDGGPYTDEQIQYAALDVYKLIDVYLSQRAEMRSDDKFMKLPFHKGLMKTWWWENEFSKVVADMEFYGTRIDKDKWYAIENEIVPQYHKELNALNEMAKRDFMPTLLENKWISEEDVFDNIWSSPSKKKEILKALYGESFDTGTSAKDLLYWLKDNDPAFPPDIKGITGKAFQSHPYLITLSDKFAFIKILIKRKAENANSIDTILNNGLKDNLFDLAVERGWIIPANTLQLNWNSPSQRLEIFRAVTPLESTGKDIIKDVEDLHPIFSHYLAFNEVAYQLKSFGKDFYDSNVELDGRFRPRFKQILATGRLSSSKPNLLAIPGKKVFRECFIPDEGNVLVGADYSAQEIVIMATLSKEPKWLEAIRNGWDIHSVNAELTYGQKWLDGTEEGCDFYKSHQKCECKVHKELRTAVKIVIFSSAYGGTFIKIAFLLKIEPEEAKQLLQDFYTRVPNLKSMMDRFGNYAIKKGRIIEPVFGRSRFVPKWKLALSNEYEAIKRFSQNFPIQSSGGAIMKISASLLRRWIRHNNYADKIKIILTVHDEILLESTPELAEIAKEKLEYFMVLGAKLGNFDIEAKAAIGQTWADCH